MSRISETELQRRLRALEKRPEGSENNFVSNEDPTDGSFSEGDRHYNATTQNLWIFSGGAWGLDPTTLHVAYASNVVGAVIEDFTFIPYDNRGFLHPWRGFWWGQGTPSGTATDYIWFETSTVASDPNIERKYTEFVGTNSTVGTPSEPGPGVEWLDVPSTSTATWEAERFNVDDIWTSWVVYPLTSASKAIPFISYTITGRNAPILDSDQWVVDAIAAATFVTGASYTNQKELGYGTTIAIQYDDIKLSGQFTSVGGTDTWTAPQELIDGDLVVDGTIVGDKMQANTITANQIAALAITTDELSAEAVTAGKVAAGAIHSNNITIDDNIEFSNSASGIIFGKNALTDPTAGAFYGRGTDTGGNPIAGFAMSSPTSSILMDSAGTFRMVGVDFYTGAPGSAVNYASPGTYYYEIAVATTDLDIHVVGAGGSGSSNAAGDQYASYKINGGSGSASSVTYYDGPSGTGTILGGYTCTGGAGAVWSVQSNVINGRGASGEASSLHGGGLGGYIHDQQVGLKGAGGGSGGGAGFNGSPNAITNNGGEAGQEVNITSIPAGTQSIRVVVGTGGTCDPIVPEPGDIGGDHASISSGASGGNGFVSITNPLGGGTKLDVDAILPFPSDITYNSVAAAGGNTPVSFGGQAGWYMVQILGHWSSGEATDANYGLQFNDSFVTRKNGYTETGGKTIGWGDTSLLLFESPPVATPLGATYNSNNGQYGYYQCAFRWTLLKGY